MQVVVDTEAVVNVRSGSAKVVKLAGINQPV